MVDPAKSAAQAYIRALRQLANQGDPGPWTHTKDSQFSDFLYFKDGDVSVLNEDGSVSVIREDLSIPIEKLAKDA